MIIGNERGKLQVCNVHLVNFPLARPFPFAQKVGASLNESILDGCGAKEQFIRHVERVLILRNV
jgi:hypothetical protein